MEINRLNSFTQLPPGAGQVKQKETEQKVSDQVDLGSDRPAVPEGVHKKWLFMNYIGADCNLKEFQALNIDNQELVGSDKNTHIVAMIDVGPSGRGDLSEMSDEDKAKPSAIDWKGGKTFYVTQDSTQAKINSPVIAEHGLNVDMSNPGTLAKFIIDTVAKFPSDHVALVLNDHGGGWTGAISDDTNGGMFTMPQIKQALDDAEKVTGKKVDILGFDCCLMADLQAAYEFKDSANILLASQETESGPGWTYSPMLGGGKGEALQMLQAAMTKKIDVSPEEFAKIVVKVNEQHQKDIPTFSATDLTKVGDLTKATDTLAQAILKTDEKAEVKKAILQAENYGGGWAPYKDMRDLDHMAGLIEKAVKDPELKEAALGVKKALSEAIIANEASPEYPNSKGLHIYGEMKADGLGADYKELKFAEDTQWDEAMDSLGKIKVPGGEGGNAGGGGQEWEAMTMTNLMANPPIPVWPDGSPKPQRKQ
jgi:hypothetical protein